MILEEIGPVVDAKSPLHPRKTSRRHTIGVLHAFSSHIREFPANELFIMRVVPFKKGIYQIEPGKLQNQGHVLLNS